MKDIAISMVTIDRSPSRNYLRETLQNLSRSGIWQSHRLHSFHLSDSEPKNQWSRLESKYYALTLHRPSFSPLIPSLNVATALMHGYQSGAKWILFMEDDVDVCHHFLDSVAIWLDLHATPAFPVYSFGTNYDAIASVAKGGGTYWRYPVKTFYGTQCFAINNENARSLSKYLEENPFYQNINAGAYDLIMQNWALQEWPNNRHFLAACPSFVQHIGRHSIINPRKDVHSFKSWPGREWSFAGLKSSMKSI